MLKKRIRLLTLCLPGLLALVLAPPCGALLISEVMYHPNDPNESLEYIELYNDRAVTEDLGRWAFTQGIGFEFPADAMLAPKSYVVIARDPSGVEAAYALTGVLGPFSGRLSNNGERITLTHPNGATVLSFAYGDSRPWPLAPDGTGHSLTRVKMGGDPAEGRSWAPSTFLYGTPGEPDQRVPQTVDPLFTVLIEVGHPGRYFKGLREPSAQANGTPTTAWTQISHDDNPASTDWLNGDSGYGYSNNSAELQNVRTLLDDMRGQYQAVYARLAFTLDADDIASFSSLQAEVSYDDGFVLYLNGTRVADSGNIAGNPPAFQDGPGTASDYAPMTVDLSPYLHLLVPGKNVLAIQGHNANLGNSSDFILAPVLRAITTPPTEPDEAPQLRLFINEVYPGSVGWIELFNPGPEAVALGSVTLSNNAQDLQRYRFAPRILNPGDFATVSAAELGWDLPVLGQSIYLSAVSSTGETRRVLDAVHCEAILPGQSFGRYPTGTDHWEPLGEPTAQGPNRYPFVHDIVINEIMYNHPTHEEGYEYIELHNRGTDTVSLADWVFTDGIDYTFQSDRRLAPGGYLVLAKDPNLLVQVYTHLVAGDNLVGPYSGSLANRRDHLRLTYPHPTDAQTLITADELTYYESGAWPYQADGDGASLELRDPANLNHAPTAWAASDESGKSSWEAFSFTISENDPQYTHDSISLVDMMLLHRGEVLLDDLEVYAGDTDGEGRTEGANRLTNADFESNTSQWRILGNHIQSHVTTTDSVSGNRSLHVVATGHGDPGANRINQSISSTSRGEVTFRGWGRWLSGNPFLLMRVVREEAPVQPPRPSQVFSFTRPLNLGTPGLENTAASDPSGPHISEVSHHPVLPAAQEPIVIQARVTSRQPITQVTLAYRSEGQGAFLRVPMQDQGTDSDQAAGDQLYTAVLPGANAGSVRAFYIEAENENAGMRFPALLPAYHSAPNQTCLVRVGDTQLSNRFATYRVWLSNDVINAFRGRPSLSNELLDCTFVYNNTEVFYNAKIRMRGSPFLRRGIGRDPRDRYGYRIEFNPEQRFRSRSEINLDNTESSNRGPLQERASYWFYEKMGLPYSRQEYVRPIINGNANGIYEDVQKIDGDYIDNWFGADNQGYIHKIDDYFEYAANGDGFSNLDEGLKNDSRHPLLPETYRWGFEKRSHRENDSWDHLFAFAVAMNTPTQHSEYEMGIESFIHPEHFLAVLALRHAVGDWDSYGFDRGKNNYFYHSLPEGKWYLLPWDIDFTLGSGRGPSQNLFSVSSSKFPEINQMLNYPKYREIYLHAFADLIEGPWQTNFGTADPPTAFDRFLDEAADALQAEGLGGGRRNSIKAYVQERRAYIAEQVRAIGR